MSKKIQIMLVDDQQLMRDGLRLILEPETDIEIIAEAGDGETAVSLYNTHNPDVVLMDVNMPVMDGVTATKVMLAQDETAKILILTTFDEDKVVLDAIRAGAKGFMLKDMSGEELGGAIRTVAGGGSLLAPSVTGKVMSALAQQPTAPKGELLEPLSERELEIGRLIAQGLSNPQIAERLFLAEGTVKNYVSNVLQKTGAKDRAEAAVTLQKLGLLN